MLLLLAKRKPYSVIRPLFDAHLHHHPLISRCGYASATQKPTSFTMVDYLIATFGFSPHKAAAISKPLAHLKSPDKPEAVRRFLNHQGFSEADVKSLVKLHPRILYASPENTLDPNLCALRGIGLSSSTLTQLILAGPATLHSSHTVSRIKFWRDFFRGDDESLVKAFKKNLGLGNSDIDRVTAPNISLLQSHGVSTHGIQRIVLKTSRVITGRITLLEDAVKRAKELGFQPESGMFTFGLNAMMQVSREALQKKMELLKSFGWSDEEFISALQKHPGIVTLTEINLRAKMDFFVGEAECDPSYISSNPVLLKLSLEKRLRPRLHVLHLLDSKGLVSKMPDFSHVSKMTNIEFIERFILPHKEDISGLQEDYLAACSDIQNINYIVHLTSPSC